MNLKTSGNFNIIKFDPQLTIANALAVQAELVNLMEYSGMHEWVLDLSLIEDIDITGLGVLVHAATTARAHGDRVLLYAPGPTTLELLENSELLGFFPLIQDEDDLISRQPD